VWLYALKMRGTVISVSRSAKHGFSKERVPEIAILAGLGVEGDAHAGATVKHRYLVKKNPTAANLCQVHLIQDSLFAELHWLGFAVAPGDLGENIATSGLDLLGLPRGTRLHLGATAVVEVTGLRTPCKQMDGFKPGLMKACLGRDAAGGVVRKAGIMGIALAGGVVRVGDPVAVEMPAGEWVKLGPV
jgi:MOSC domain-containing protein YiiM